MIELIEIGFSKKPYGKDGFLKIQVNDSFTDSLAKARALFIELDGSCVPFLIEKIQFKGDAIIKLEEIDNPQEASELTNRTVYLEEKEVHISSTKKVVAKYKQLIGYHIFDNSSNKKVGTIQSFEEYPSQLMAVIIKDNQNVLIPFHADWITAIDTDKTEIVMDLPEGLINE